jgi:hypothetical protein
MLAALCLLPRQWLLLQLVLVKQRVLQVKGRRRKRERKMRGLRVQSQGLLPSGGPP